MKQLLALLIVVLLLSCQKETVTSQITVSNEVVINRPIVGIGSSSIVKWPDSSFVGYNWVNLGRGGYSIGNLQAKMNWDSIIALNPKQVIFWCGDNDIYYKRSYTLIVGDFKWIVNKLIQAIPDLNFQLMYIKPTGPNKNIVYTYPSGSYNGWTISEWFNRDMTSWGKTAYPTNFNTVDTYAPFLLWNPKRLNTIYYNSDLVHFNQAYGYKKINQLIKPKLLQ